MAHSLPPSGQPTAAVVRRKYFLVFAGLIALFLVVQGMLQMAFTYRENKASIAEIQLAAAWGAAAKLESYLDSIVRQLHEVNALPWSPGFLEDEDRRDEFRRLLKIVPAIFEIRHFNDQGLEMVYVSRIASDRVGPGTLTADAARTVELRARGTWYGPTYFRNLLDPYVSVAVADPAGAGYTVAEINLKFVADVVGAMRIGKAGRAFVVDSANLLVAHPNLSLVLRRIDLSAYPPVRALRDASQPAVPAAAGAAGTSQTAAMSGPPPLRLLEAESFESGRVLTSAVPIAATNWWVFVEQPYSEALQSVFATLYRTLFILLLGLLVAFVASYWWARTLTAPILKLRAGASRIGAGDLDARIDIKTGDEVQALADEFNRMAGKLRESYSGLEQKISDKTMQLELANRHKSEFLANMSHELRTPLNAVIGFSDVLQNQYFGQLNDRQQQYVRDINESGQHLLALINDSLDLSKVEAGRMDLELSRFGLPGAIDNAIVQIRERALRQNLELSATIAPGVGEIVADQRKLRQILINLLTNAVKFTYPGGQVEVLAARGTSETLVTVRDSGPGIATEDQATIFEEFRQLKTQGSAAQEGTGLGLSLVRRLVELHHGRVWVESEPGHGAAFSFTLPDRELPPTA